MSVEFLITSFIVIVSPGTGVHYTLAAGLSRGSRASETNKWTPIVQALNLKVN
jgi:threonine/homoserine/homoserine lactone efflux protein